MGQLPEKNATKAATARTTGKTPLQPPRGRFAPTLPEEREATGLTPEDAQHLEAFAVEHVDHASAVKWMKPGRMKRNPASAPARYPALSCSRVDRELQRLGSGRTWQKFRARTNSPRRSILPLDLLGGASGRSGRAGPRG